jgi:L-alanine-DL-glutamate epimerase-like enolase superfamily enzyme
MELTEIACYAVSIPSKDGTYVMSGGRKHGAFLSTVVKVVSSDGTTGFGEACTLGSNYIEGFAESTQSTIRALAPLVLACNPMEPDIMVDQMDDMILGHLPGKAAIDIAMWDLRGKLLGLPVAMLLGGVRQHTLGAFTAISMDKPSAMVKDASTFAQLGYTRWQLKLGDDPIEDAERVHAVAGAVAKDAQFITSDANRGWTVGQALRFVQAIHDVDTYVEQPCQSIPELALVRPHCRQPMIIDEAAREARDVMNALAARCVDGINIKPVRIGGLTKAARIRDLAHSAGLMMMIDEPQGADLATASMVQLAATVRPKNFLGVSFFSGSEMTISYKPDNDRSGPEIANGEINWKDAPGLGIAIDEEKLGEPLFVLTQSNLAAERAALANGG